MVRKLFLAPALCLLASTANAACSGTFSASYFCGTGATGGAPGPHPYSAIFSTIPLPSADIFVGNAGGIATAVAPVSAGDCTWVVSNTGTFTQTCTKTNGVAFATSATTDTTNASNITTGTLGTARLPAPFTNGTRQGNTSAFVTYAGTTPTALHIATFDANGNIQDGGASTGTVTTTGSPAAHQTAVFTAGTVIEGIVAGSVGQALVSSGTGADPSYQSGPWTLLATLTASNSATLSDTTHFTSAYNDYEIEFTDIIAATTSVSGELQMHSGGSFQATSYIGNAIYLATSNPQTTYIPLSYAANVLSGSPGMSGKLFLLGFNVASTPKWITGQIGYTISGPSAIPLNLSGYWNSTSAIDGFQFLFSSGNITSGTIKVYGRL